MTAVSRRSGGVYYVNGPRGLSAALKRRLVRRISAFMMANKAETLARVKLHEERYNLPKTRRFWFWHECDNEKRSSVLLVSYKLVIILASAALDIKQGSAEAADPLTVDLCSTDPPPIDYSASLSFAAL